jgi:DNA-binding NarL/FixJ family response regulator
MRLILADDSTLFREGLAALLAERGFEIVGQAGTAGELIDLVEREQPDAVVTDIRMPPTQTTEGLEAAREIRRDHPEVGVVVLSQVVETHHAVELLREAAGGTGYMLKDRVGDVDELAEAVRRVANGGSAIDPEVVSTLLGRRRQHDPLQELTGREREILGLMAEGLSNQGIVERLFLSPKTVETHIHSVFSKLGLPAETGDHRRVRAVLAYLRR